MPGEPTTRAEFMISYGQNAEDVVLRRAFPADHRGFYIDVGANDPTRDSVTRHFYDRGWRGINIEPVPRLLARLAAERPRDINLNLGISDRDGELTFFEAAEKPGLSTFSEPQAREHARHGTRFLERRVRVVTLARVCEDHEVKEIDFLSVDVEGLEGPVLAGADLVRWRPRVMLVEATRPNTTEPTHQAWEPALLRSGYLFATFDGLNRYYVRDEDAALAERLRVPPNWFDNFVPYAHWVWRQELERLRTRLEDRPVSTAALARARRFARAHPRLARAVRRALARGR